MTMPANRYLGTMLPRASADDFSTAAPAQQRDFERSWLGASRDFGFSLRASEGALTGTYSFGSIVLLVRGYVVPAGSYRVPDPAQVAHEIVRQYQERGELPVDRLEGSFSLALLDGENDRVLLYRGLLGNTFTYYTETRGGFMFAHNLADLIDASDRAPTPNHAALPAFFLTRYVFGRATLAEGYFRLMPGELVRFDAKGLTRSQRLTLADLAEDRPIGRDAAERVEEAMTRVLADCAAIHPHVANLLSGGVDSSYIQMEWNRATTGPEGGQPRSYSASLDHDRTRTDDEYALSAARALGVSHKFVPIEGPYAPNLLAMIGATAEVPNHVQTVYFPRVADSMVADGVLAGLCGEGADGLLGVGPTIAVQYAQLIRRAFPWSGVRRVGRFAARAIGWEGLRVGFELSDFVNDLTHPAHPINEMSVFAEFPPMYACFGEAAVEESRAARRSLADQYGVGGGVLERLHAAGFLGEAVDTAAIWTELFNGAGADLHCPFLDSRMVRVIVNTESRYRFPFRRPKALLKETLARRGFSELAYRPKRGFGQPIFEWMAPGGQLRPLVESISEYEFLKPGVLEEALQRPNWFLFSLLTYDVWHKQFVSKTLPRAALTGSGARGDSDDADLVRSAVSASAL
jgi:asparagine synthase (glutamine-hydrolysing)